MKYSCKKYSVRSRQNIDLMECLCLNERKLLQKQKKQKTFTIRSALDQFDG